MTMNYRNHPKPTHWTDRVVYALLVAGALWAIAGLFS